MAAFILNLISHTYQCLSHTILQVLSTDIDLLHPPAELEKQKHKTKRLVQSPNSFFMDVKCQGCFQMCVPYPISPLHQ